MNQKRFAKLSVVALAVTLGVILWGAFVRATGSGAGCGSHWPTCNGQVIPRAASTATLIEFTHRLTSGVAFILVALQLVWALKAFPPRHRVRRGAFFSMLFMVTEAAIGAGLVLFEYVAHNASLARAVWMCAHLINTFLLLAAMTCTLVFAHTNVPLQLRERGKRVALLAVALGSTLLVGVTGAVAALGDTLFPQMRHAVAQDLAPTSHFLLQLRVLHPVVAVAAAAYVLALSAVLTARSSYPPAQRFGRTTAVLVVLQIGAGLLNLALFAPVWMQLVHLLLADLVWIGLITFAITALSQSNVAYAPDIGPQPSVAPAGSGSG